MQPELDLPQHWSDFLEAVDKQLETPVTLHCIGGFVVEAVYGIPRRTADLDYISIDPGEALPTLEEIAGQQSELRRVHKLYLQMVAVVDVPDNYEKRLKKLALGLKMIQLSVLDSYDLILTKLARNSGKDREDVKALAKLQNLSFSILAKRYEEEMKPWIANAKRYDATVQLWKEFFPR